MQLPLNAAMPKTPILKTLSGYESIDIPESIASVATIDSAKEVDPESVGMTKSGVEEIWKTVTDIYRTKTHQGISLCLRKQGQVLLHRSIGHASGNGPNAEPFDTKVLLRPETPICFFSVSKAVTAFLIHLLREDKLINFHDPVSFYLPEFAQNGKQNITIHQVLSHRSGIPGLPKGTPPETIWQPDAVWKLLCEAESSSVKGDKLSYHALTAGFVLERLCQVVTGESLQTILDERIRKPMGMKYFRYGIEPKYTNLVAENHTSGFKPVFPMTKLVERALGGSMSLFPEVTNCQSFKNAVIPAGNMMGTAEEASRFFQMLLNEGEWNGKQICDPMTVKRMTHEYAALQFDRTLMLPMRYSAGLMLGGSPYGLWGKDSAQAFGHVGITNKLCWADPAKDISVGLMTTGAPLVSPVIPSLARFLGAVTRNAA